MPVGGILLRFAVEFRACFESPRVGVGMRLRKSRGSRPPLLIARDFVLLASGVGNKPDPVASVRGAKGRSRYAVPLRVIPARGQVSENSAKPPSKESWDVLHDD